MTSPATGVPGVALENLTPHDVTLVTAEGQSITIPPSGAPARLALARHDVGVVPVGDGCIPIGVSVPQGPPDLPAPQPGRLLIVSRMVAASSPGRGDLVFPDDLVRDAEGIVVGCRRLAVLAGSNDAETTAAMASLR